MASFAPKHWSFLAQTKNVFPNIILSNLSFFIYLWAVLAQIWSRLQKVCGFSFNINAKKSLAYFYTFGAVQTHILNTFWPVLVSMTPQSSRLLFQESLVFFYTWVNFAPKEFFFALTRRQEDSESYLQNTYTETVLHIIFLFL